MADRRTVGPLVNRRDVLPLQDRRGPTRQPRLRDSLGDSRSLLSQAAAAMSPIDEQHFGCLPESGTTSRQSSATAKASISRSWSRSSCGSRSGLIGRTVEVTHLSAAPPPHRGQSAGPERAALGQSVFTGRWVSRRRWVVPLRSCPDRASARRKEVGVRMCRLWPAAVAVEPRRAIAAGRR
jgi:hypothetical protein